jgi:RimJ/RimL family protein N-acetyltransferase
MSAATIETKNLKLISHSPQHVLALIEGTEKYAQSFGWPPANGLREFYVSKDVSPQWLEQLKTATVTDPWTHGFGVLHVASGQVIGGAGFKGPPAADGTVEIAYGIVPEFQGKGYATEAAMALVDFARKSGRVRTARAHTLAQKNASCRVLTKCGFEFVGELIDPEDGPVWRWEKPLHASEQGTTGRQAG